MRAEAGGNPRSEYDAAIIGGAFSGAATAILLKRARPDLRVVIIDSKSAFDRKVGESAIELSSWFLTHGLGLDRHLALEHLPKYGLRFWFGCDRTSLSEASELGNLYQTSVPSYHIDRAVLDEHVLGLAAREGAELMRPARVADVELNEGDSSVLRIEAATGPETIRSRWVVDASGRKAFLARRLGLLEPMGAHPTRSIWARYRGTGDFDAPPSRRDGRRRETVCARGLSTNHLTGPGWWVWLIPLPGGDTSVGIVWDDRLFDLPAGGSPAARFEAFLESIPAGRELLGDATRIEGDLHSLSGLPYRVNRVMGDGWAAVGDAAGFLDPFYSTGLDWAAMTAVKTGEIIARAPSGEELRRSIDRHNRDLLRGFDRWFEAIYRDKYFYMGDAELMGVALRLEVPMYYFGVVGQPYRLGYTGLETPFSRGPAFLFYHLMRFVNRRLAGLGKVRLAAGTWGRRNAGRHDLLTGFKLGPRNLRSIPGVLLRLGILELRSVPDRIAARRRGAGRDSRRLAATPAAQDPP